VDVTFMSGYGFPRHRGGPMKWADMYGLPRLLADIEAFAKEDPLFWKPSPLLVKLVAEGRNFDSLNQLPQHPPEHPSPHHPPPQHLSHRYQINSC
jgi:3-hydroxyacyl-CoA dehydrogenase